MELNLGIIILTFIVDIIECDEDPEPCDGNATCTNNIGSFTCECNEGYTGNGTDTCDGMFSVT